MNTTPSPVDTQTIPLLPAPDTTGVQLLLLEHEVDAYVSGWTGWHADAGQTKAGAYVMTYLATPEARAAALDVLIEAGYVVEEFEATITVHFDRANW